MFVKTGNTLGVGCTIRVDKEVVQVMSDIWEDATRVTYWDEAEGTIRTAFVNSRSDAVIDYTPEVLRKYLTRYAETFFKNTLASMEVQLRAQHSRIEKGSKVKVLGGRHGEVGKEYLVFHTMIRPYNRGHYKTEQLPIAGLAVDDEMHEVVGKNGKAYSSYKNTVWVWCKNLEVVGVNEAVAAGMPLLKTQAKERMNAEVAKVLAEIQKQQKDQVQLQQQKVA